MLKLGKKEFLDKEKAVYNAIGNTVYVSSLNVSRNIVTICI